MNQEKLTVPAIFRGLRILLIDSDTESLLHLASKLESFSYRVTTTELPTIALSILQERADRFDLIMAEIKMPEMNCSSFINSVQLIKDLPIMLISAESKKNVIEEAMMEGACFFLKKPISSKNLKNVWQHFYRKTREREMKSGDDDGQEAESQEAEAEKKEMVEAVNNVGMKLQRAWKKRCASSQNISQQVGESKRRKKDGNQDLMIADSPDFEAAFLDLLGSCNEYNVQLSPSRRRVCHVSFNICK